MQNTKIITEEVLWEMLEEKGIKQPADVDHEEALKAVLDHFEASITDDWDDTCNMKFYKDSTVDGYEVHVVQYGAGWDGLSVSENIYYYDHDWLDEMPQAIRDGSDIYYSELNEDTCDFQDIISRMYEELHDSATNVMADKLIDEGWVEPNDVAFSTQSCTRERIAD